MALTPKQQAFVQSYSGNGTAAARAAGYRGNDHTLAQVARENLLKPEVRRAIDAREAGPARSRIATREERQAFWTRTLLDATARMPDRLKASELLGRSQADFTDKVEHSADASLEALLLAARAKAGK